MNCCDHNECCDHSNDRIGAEIGMLHNLLRRQMACMTEKTANAANVTGMQAMIVHHLIIHEKQGDIPEGSGKRVPDAPLDRNGHTAADGAARHYPP